VFFSQLSAGVEHRDRDQWCEGNSGTTDAIGTIMSLSSASCRLVMVDV
jgi:hypothetical protein